MTMESLKQHVKGVCSNDLLFSFVEVRFYQTTPKVLPLNKSIALSADMFLDAQQHCRLGKEVLPLGILMGQSLQLHGSNHSFISLA